MSDEKRGTEEAKPEASGGLSGTHYDMHEAGRRFWQKQPKACGCTGAETDHDADCLRPGSATPASPTRACAGSTPMPDAKKPCGCRKRINDTLAEKYNATLAGSGQAWDFSTGTVVPQTSILLAVQKLDSSKRTKLPLLAASYCPFCGQDMTQ